MYGYIRVQLSLRLIPWATSGPSYHHYFIITLVKHRWNCHSNSVLKQIETKHAKQKQALVSDHNCFGVRVFLCFRLSQAITESGSWFWLVIATWSRSPWHKIASQRWLKSRLTLRWWSSVAPTETEIGRDPAASVVSDERLAQGPEVVVMKLRLHSETKQKPSRNSLFFWFNVFLSFCVSTAM